MKTQKTLIGLLLILLFIVGCQKEQITKKTIRPVKTAKATIKSSLTEHNFPGIIKANKDSKLAFRVSGTIAELYFEEGEFVEEDQVIVKIDDRDYKLQVKATKAKYEEISAEVDRVVELFKRNSVSRSDYDKAIASKAIAAAKYQAALNQLEDTSLKAPFSGYIQNIYFDDHETISKGLPVISMVDISDLKVESDIPSKVYLQADNFSSFSCHPEELPNLELPLKLKGLRNKANMNELYKIIFSLDNNSEVRLAPGMIVDVKIAVDSKDNQKLIVPISSVLHKDGKTLIWILGSDSTANLREITIGNLFSDGSIEVIGGLTTNDIIIIAGIHTISVGEKVKTIEQTSSDNVGGLL